MIIIYILTITLVIRNVSFSICSSSYTDDDDISEIEQTNPTLQGNESDEEQQILLSENDLYPQHFSYIKEDEKILLAYKHSKRFYIKSDEFIGELKVFNSTFSNGGPFLYIKKSQIMEQVKHHITKILKKPVKFYGKNNSSPLLGCYVDTFTNEQNVCCVNALVNGKPELLPVKNLCGKICKLTAILRSGSIKKVNNEHFWSLAVTELKIDDIADEQIGYFKHKETHLNILK